MGRGPQKSLGLVCAMVPRKFCGKFRLALRSVRYVCRTSLRWAAVQAYHSEIRYVGATSNGHYFHFRG